MAYERSLAQFRRDYPASSHLTWFDGISTLSPRSMTPLKFLCDVPNTPERSHVGSLRQAVWDVGIIVVKTE